MRAVVRTRDGVRLERRPVPLRRPGWVRIRVLLAGICRTDLYAAEGLFPLSAPRVLGHELVGEITEADAGSALPLGARVTVAPLIGCEDCAGCGRGQRCLCPRMLGVDLDGAFAEELVVPEGCAHRVPETLPLRRAAYVEPVAASLAVTKAPIRTTDRGAILGTGRIAALTARILGARGFARVSMVDADIDDGSFDFVIETSATADVLARALRLVKPGGVVVLKSRPARSVPLAVARAVLNDVTLAAVGYGSFAEAITLARELDVDDLLGEIVPLDAFAEAFEKARDARGAPKLFLAPTDAV